MRKRLVAIALLSTFSWSVSPSSIFAQTAKNGLVGTWQWLSVVNTRPDGATTQPFGPKPGGYLSFDAGGRFVWLITAPGRAKFESGKRDQGTADENRATVQGSLAYCGTYAISNDTLIMKIEASTYPNEEGAEQRRTFKLDGDQLTWKNPTVSTGASGVARLERLP